MSYAGHKIIEATFSGMTTYKFNNGERYTLHLLAKKHIASIRIYKAHDSDKTIVYESVNAFLEEWDKITVLKQ